MKPVAVTLGDYTDKNARLLRIINDATLPVQYADRFYASVRPEWTRYGTAPPTPAQSSHAPSSLLWRPASGGYCDAG